jgi:serine/threonine-protein kinase HipA
MADELGVWLRDVRIGTLRSTRRGATFQYADDVASAERGLPMLSAALPVGAELVPVEETRSWFTGLLPEEQQRAEVARRFGLESGTYFDMLREIGWECAGAVVIAAEGAKPPVGSLRRLTAAGLAERLSALPAHPYDDNDAIRVSLGGYQAKMLATQTDAGWALPVGGAISTHILKPQPRDRWPGIIDAEAWAMTAAANVTSTANVHKLVLDDAPATLVVERFDRLVGDGVVSRSHQEDAAQAIGVPPEKKYASSGSASRSDPTLAAIAAVLERYADDPRREQLNLLRQVVVNVAVGNTDAHAKNYGVLHPTAQTLALSPMYDVVPAQVINPANLEMGLRVAGRIRIGRVTGAAILDEAQTWGIGRRISGEVVEDALQRLSVGAQLATDRFPETDPAVLEFVLERIRHLLDTLRSTE